MGRFIKTPLLDRLALALRQELDSLSLDELIELDRECKRTTDFNCEASRRMIANHYGAHVSATVHSSTVRYLRDDAQVSYSEFWESLAADFTDPDTGKVACMLKARKALSSGKTVSAGQVGGDKHSYKITYDTRTNQNMPNHLSSECDG